MNALLSYDTTAKIQFSLVITKSLMRTGSLRIIPQSGYHFTIIKLPRLQ
jgi:hypothetical protein